MLEPVEAEFAQPPIYTDAQEEILRDEDEEEADAITIVPSRVSSPASRTTTCTNSPQSHSATTLAGEPPSNDSKENVHKSAGDAEKLGNGRMTVRFDPGENPKEWTKARKWQVHLLANNITHKC